jgi:beta-glucanase (GH16 family)
VIAVDHALWRGQVSQTAQLAPMNHGYQLTNGDTSATTVYNASITEFNSYRGSPYQQAASALTYIDGQDYNDTGYAPYGFEWWSDPSDRDAGYITWFSEGQKTWRLTAASVGPDNLTNVSQRLISEEPHVSGCVIPQCLRAGDTRAQYLIMNLGMSPTFQGPDFEHLRFPAKMYIDYVRVYQREDVGTDALTCDPASYPTSSYINKYVTYLTSTCLLMNEADIRMRI